MASISRALESAIDLMLRVPIPELLNGELERSMNMAVDGNRMVFSSYAGNWPRISDVIALDCKKAVKSQQMLDIPFT